MGGQRNLIIAAVAVVIGIFAVIVANSYFGAVQQRQADIAQQQKLARIVVADQALAFGSPLTQDNLRMANWPANSVPSGAFTTIGQALANNRVALRPIVPGEPVLADKVSGTDGRATLAATLKPGMRAVTIPISNVTGVAGFALPGLTVDVLLTRQIPGDGAQPQDQMSDVILTNAHILAIDQLADEKTGEPKVGGTATLETTLMDAQRLAVAQKIGTLSLALRNIENQNPEALTTVTARDLGGNGLYKPGRPQRAEAPTPTVIMPTMVRATAVPIAAAVRAVAAAPSGGSLTVYRGTERSEYTVGRLGGQ